MKSHGPTYEEEDTYTPGSTSACAALARKLPKIKIAIKI
jgi:hypothetical protein